MSKKIIKFTSKTTFFFLSLEINYEKQTLHRVTEEKVAVSVRAQ